MIDNTPKPRVEAKNIIHYHQILNSYLKYNDLTGFEFGFIY